MYEPRILPMALNALFRPLASTPIPAVAAKATRARIKRYSTKPWPASSLCSRAREFRTKVVIRFSLLRIFNVPAPNAFGGCDGSRSALLYWQVGGQIGCEIKGWSLPNGGLKLKNLNDFFH